MGYSRWTATKIRAVAKGSMPPVMSAKDMTRGRVDGRRLDTLHCALIQVICACGHTGEVPVQPLVQRHGRATRVREALGSVRCSRCGGSNIRQVHAFR